MESATITTGPSPLQFDSNGLVIGRDSFTGGSYFHGLIDEVMYFDHVISVEAIWQHYNCANLGIAVTH